MMDTQNDIKRLEELIDMIGSMARLDFSKRLEVEVTNHPVDVMAHGLNMLSEELEYNVVKKSMLEEVNHNLERFAFTVAHDMKSPLSSAFTLITLIEMELEGVENNTLKEYFKLLQQINERTLNMVNGILEYSRTNFNNIVITEVDLTKICADIAKEYSINKNVVINFDSNMPKVQYNEFALTQIFSNLVSNAVKHNDKDVCQLDIKCADKDSFYEVSVTDNGPGIKDNDREKIFELFENLKTDKTTSHGVGLSIVKKLITQANGSIWVKSEDKKGSSFIFTIEKRNNNYQNSLAG